VPTVHRLIGLVAFLLSILIAQECIRGELGRLRARQASTRLISTPMR
jgi:hypothetical protein